MGLCLTSQLHSEVVEMFVEMDPFAQTEESQWLRYLKIEQPLFAVEAMLTAGHTASSTFAVGQPSMAFSSYFTYFAIDFIVRWGFSSDCFHCFDQKN